MDLEFSSELINIIRKKKFINEWLKKDFSLKPIMIFGNKGNGKSMLAEYILKNTTTIKIDIEFCKNKIIFDDFIDSTLKKKNIRMMFDNKNCEKSLIIDDFDYISKNDKFLFKSICDFFKNKNFIKNYKIIIITNEIKNKNIQQIYKKCFPIMIELSDKNIFNLTKKYLTIGKGFNDKQIKNLIKKSNNNFNIIKNNIDFYQNKTENIVEIDKEHNDTIILLKNMIEKNDISYTYQMAINDYYVIGLNILENCKNIKSKNDIKNLIKIYDNFIIGDNFYYKLYQYNSEYYINNIITYCSLLPIFYYKKINNFNYNKFIYNKYISQSIIYIHNQNLLIENNLHITDLFNIYNFYLEYLEKKEEIFKKKINLLIETFGISNKIINKFLKNYNYIYGQDIKKLIL